ncbi:unnamed protein product [Nippostrongylus brasiliensis]|uniref:Exosome complex component RRP4 (inferred by orthology to a human protein) n=1 Tax=Nippostrongylus brasiliensis TaxID=27835 RepID=A0A0N4Y9Y6_NIPBR|nr:unnamed protein product [Nippostrongylus brasiliensis]
MLMRVTGLPSTRVQRNIPREERHDDIVHCGQILSLGASVMSGHGTIPIYGQLAASISGRRVQYSRLFIVEPYKSKYAPKIGDVVVGRICNIRKAHWKVDVNCRIAAILHLNNVNLPGGELRRKSVEDEIAMVRHLSVGDTVSAEIQRVSTKGRVQLHTRNLKYGKLGQGILVRIAPCLVKPQTEYLHEMFGVGLVIGCNGMIWISAGQSSDGGYCTDVPSVIPVEKRRIMVRTAACIRLLATNLICVYDVSIMSAFNASLPFDVKELIHPDVSPLLIHNIIAMIKTEEKRRSLEKDMQETAKKRRFL